jgi:hypothetical protein
VSGAGLERRVEHLEEACYTELSPLERFRLIIEGGARDDFEAADRLWDACPTGTYRQADAAFSGRVRAAELICLAVYADLNYLLGRVCMAEAIGETLLGLIEDAMTDGYFAGYADAGGNIADVDDETAEVSRSKLTIGCTLAASASARSSEASLQAMPPRSGKASVSSPARRSRSNPRCSPEASCRRWPTCKPQSPTSRPTRKTWLRVTKPLWRYGSSASSCTARPSRSADGRREALAPLVAPSVAPARPSRNL